MAREVEVERGPIQRSEPRGQHWSKPTISYVAGHSGGRGTDALTGRTAQKLGSSSDGAQEAVMVRYWRPLKRGIEMPSRMNG